MAAFLRRWICWVSVGELAGFCVPTVAATLLADAPPVALLGALVVAGAAEGTVLGWTQSRAMRDALPEVSGPRWVTLTAAGAALAWFCGMLAPTTYETWRHWAIPVQITLAVVVGGSFALLGYYGVEIYRTAPPVPERVVTVSGRVAFTGDDSGHVLAIDSRTGKMLWHYQMGSPVHGTSPTTFMLDGKQIVLVPAGGTLVAFALP